MYIRADWDRHGTLPYRKPRLALHMPKKISDVAIERVPSLRNRISSFQSKLAIAHYAHGTITDYCHALYKAVVCIGKLPDDFSQDDVDGLMQICEEKGWEIGLCPHCKCRMRVIEILEPSREPPSKGTSSRIACL